MKTLINDVLFQAHVDGDCGATCEYCLMEDELNEVHEFNEQKKSKKANNAKYEKALRKE